MGRKRDDDSEDDARSTVAAGGLTRQRVGAAQTVLCVTALLLSLVLLQQLATRPVLSARSAAPAREGVLLDGRDVAKPLPLVFPNGAKSAHRCDLPSLRYQCELDRTTGCRAYPQLFPMRELLTNWSPDEPTRPPAHTFESICRFNVSDPVSDFERVWIVKNSDSFYRTLTTTAWDMTHAVRAAAGAHVPPNGGAVHRVRSPRAHTGVQDVDHRGASHSCVCEVYKSS